MTNKNNVGTPASFDDVVVVIRSERDYQRRRWGRRHPEGGFVEVEKSITDFMVYMQDYLTEAFHRASREPGCTGALEVLRKVVTLGVACMEQHGAPPRLMVAMTNARDNQPA